MNFVRTALEKASRTKYWFLKTSLITKVVTITIILGLGWLTVPKLLSNKSSSVKYQTAAVERDTLIVTVTASGQVSATNNSPISTQATGVVSHVYAKDGDQVKAGDKIADITLDLSGQQNSAQTLASYQTAKNNLDTAKLNLYTTQSDMFTKWKLFFDLSTNSTYQNSDGSPNYNNRSLAEFHISEDNWLASEAKYKLQQNVVGQAQTGLNAAWLSYQQASPIIYAPISGVVSGLSLQVGSVIGTKIATVKTTSQPTVTINLTEIDVPKVKIGNKATLTFDALPGKSYTGQIVSIETAGAVSSGVTTYPTVIKLDTESPEIFSNMSAQANVITDIKDNVLFVPTGAVQTQNGQSTVKIMKNNRVVQAQVETGLASSTQIEIISGISEGETVVTGTTSTTLQTGQTQSVFGSFGGRGGGAGGNGLRIGR